MEKPFLLNLHRLFVYIRSDIERVENKAILETAITTLENDSNNDFLVDSFKKLHLYESNINHTVEDIAICDIIQTNNIDNGIVYSKEKLKEMLLYAMEKLLYLLHKKAYEEAYDLTDAIHVLPELIAQEICENNDSFWEVYIEPIRHKWNIDYFDDYRDYFKGVD